MKKCGSYGRNHGCVCRTETAAGICNRQVDADDSVQEIHDAGAQMQRAFAQANESYETLMTAPRSDMGIP